jgi:hypothetical protein
MRKKKMGQWGVVIQSLEKSGRKINSMLEFALQKGGGYLMRFRIDNLSPKRIEA